MRTAILIAVAFAAGCSIQKEQQLSTPTVPEDHPCVDLYQAIDQIELEYPTITFRYRCKVESDGVTRCGWAVNAGDIYVASRAVDFSDAVSQAYGERVDGTECPTHLDAETLTENFDDVKFYWRCKAQDTGECQHSWGVATDGTWVVNEAYPLSDAVSQAMAILDLPSASNQDTGSSIIP